MSLRLLRPDWPVPAAVRAVVTTRGGGVSRGPFAALNLADHVGDDPAAVAANRELLARALGLPASPGWLEQVHGCAVANAEAPECGPADAVVATTPGAVCAVLTADCLPVLFAARDASRVAAAHAGWRGLAAGVLEATIDRLGGAGGELVAWLGPAIGPDAFEVGDEVRAAFVDPDPDAAAAFRATRPGHWLADLYALARRRLAARGVGFVGGGGYCTLARPDLFYSYRRDGVTGRFASLVWLAPEGSNRKGA